MTTAIRAGSMEPDDGFEPPTYRLQGDCTTTVLIRHLYLNFLKPFLIWVFDSCARHRSERTYKQKIPVINNVITYFITTKAYLVLCYLPVNHQQLHY